nr:hypothetical protein [Clostridia bacterium]
MYFDILSGTPLFDFADKRGREKMREYIFNTSTGVEYTTIGKSLLGEPIECYKIGKGRGRVALFGAHHAKESITANLLYAFIYVLSSDRYHSLMTRGTSREHFLNLFSFFVIPCVNPDGIEVRSTGRLHPLFEKRLSVSEGELSAWQSNGRGVDLNHNYDAGFSEYKRIERERDIRPGATLYSGEYPESEPESRACAAFSRAASPIAVVSLHSQGREIYFSGEGAVAAAHRLSELSGYRVTEPSGTAKYGGLCDYTGGVLGIPSFTLEVGEGKNPLSLRELPGILSDVGRGLYLLPSFISNC